MVHELPSIKAALATGPTITSAAVQNPDAELGDDDLDGDLDTDYDIDELEWT